MREDTKQLIKKQINILNEKIDDKEDKVRNWNAVYLTGLVGGTIGVIGLDKGKIIAGMIVGISGVIFRTINAIALNNFETEKDILEYDLEHPDNVMEYDLDEDENDKGGKHFRK
ncbi:MAG: hypothetical protein IAA85_00075 [Firmicutes bacterium]|nr:hypothetical protein [Candidatus Alectryobacillus merdavium]